MNEKMEKRQLVLSEKTIRRMLLSVFATIIFLVEAFIAVSWITPISSVFFGFLGSLTIVICLYLYVSSIINLLKENRII